MFSLKKVKQLQWELFSQTKLQSTKQAYKSAKHHGQWDGRKKGPACRPAGRPGDVGGDTQKLRRYLKTIRFRCWRFTRHLDGRRHGTAHTEIGIRKSKARQHKWRVGRQAASQVVTQPANPPASKSNCFKRIYIILIKKMYLSFQATKKLNGWQ